MKLAAVTATTQPMTSAYSVGKDARLSAGTASLALGGCAACCCKVIGIAETLSGELAGATARACATRDTPPLGVGGGAGCCSQAAGSTAALSGGLAGATAAKPGAGAAGAGAAAARRARRWPCITAQGAMRWCAGASDNAAATYTRRALPVMVMYRFQYFVWLCSRRTRSS